MRKLTKKLTELERQVVEAVRSGSDPYKVVQLPLWRSSLSRQRIISQAIMRARAKGAIRYKAELGRDVIREKEGPIV